MSNVTQILERVEQGDGKAAEELRKLAAAKMAQEAAGQSPDRWGLKRPSTP